MTSHLRLRLSRTVSVLALIATAGCATNPSTPQQSSSPLTSPQEQTQQRLDAQARDQLSTGIAHYQAGRYPQAEGTLLSRDIWDSSHDLRLSALKYLGFTYCVSERPTLCRQAFDHAFQLDPAFSLDAAERAHPIWGPVFDAAHAASQPTATLQANPPAPK